ncbi:hypothetical protein BEL04_23685 [Mucilaginibacter sp. PPCGB 2223]|nr:hypothetical protein BEL04_23685 [Mucilaginibacter sp. PPCGB 2223]
MPNLFQHLSAQANEYIFKNMILITGKYVGLDCGIACYLCLFNHSGNQSFNQFFKGVACGRAIRSYCTGISHRPVSAAIPNAFARSRESFWAQGSRLTTSFTGGEL